MTISNLDTAVTISKALGHHARLRIVAMLRSGEMCVCQITEVLGLAQSTVSTHLRELKRAGLIAERKEGRWVWVSLASTPSVASWIKAAVGSLEGDDCLDEDERMVREIRCLPVEAVCRLGYQGALDASSRSGGA